MKLYRAFVTREAHENRRALRAAAALWVTAVLFWVPSVIAAAPGQLIEVSHSETLAPAQIEGKVATLFEGHPAPQARYTVDAYLVRFQSLYPDDSAAVITAQLFVPRTAEQRQLPLYVFAPGTTGLVDACRPSREHIAGIHWGLYRSHVLAFAGKGTIGVLPDYTGFGDPDSIQPLFHARTEGRMMLDSVRAVHQFFAQHDAPVRPAAAAFLAGFSQGGHAAFAAADLRDEYAPDVRLAGIIGYGATTDMQVLFGEFPVVAPMVVHVFSEIYGAERFDPQQILQDRWLEQLEHHVTRQCIGAMQSYYPWSARDMFRPRFADVLLEGRLEDQFPEIHRILQRNSSGLSGHGIPALILQGTEDIVIAPESQQEFVTALQARGSDVRYLVYEGEPHDTRQVGFADVLEWMHKGP